MRRHGEGYEDIASALKDMGYLSDKTGKPLTTGGVYDLVNRKPARTPKTFKRTKTQAPAQLVQYDTNDRSYSVVIMAAIQALKSTLSDAEKIVLATTILEGADR